MFYFEIYYWILQGKKIVFLYCGYRIDEKGCYRKGRTRSLLKTDCKKSLVSYAVYYSIV